MTQQGSFADIFKEPFFGYRPLTCATLVCACGAAGVFRSGRFPCCPTYSPGLPSAAFRVEFADR